MAPKTWRAECGLIEPGQTRAAAIAGIGRD